MRVIFKGDAVRNTFSLDTGLKKIEGGDVGYFVREPKLVHEAKEIKDGVLLDRNMSFNKIMLMELVSNVTIDELVFHHPTIVDVDFDKDIATVEVDGKYTINDEDAEEKIETYNKLMEDYMKQRGGLDATFDECPCSESTDFTGEEYDELKEKEETSSEEKAEIGEAVEEMLDDLFEFLTSL